MPKSMPAATDPKVIPAATAVIFRKASSGPPELLMVQRSRAMRFAGGAAVFPGGRVDPADGALAARLYPAEDPEVATSRIAAIRETLEETGLIIGVREPVSPAQAADARAMLLADGRLAPVLEAFGWTLAPERLVLYAHWCAPIDPAFDTRFFVVDLNTGAVDITVDETENTKLFWVTAAAALELADRGEISVIFPTRRNLERLSQFASFEEVLVDSARHPATRIRAAEVERDGQSWLLIPEGTGYPVLGEPLNRALRG